MELTKYQRKALMRSKELREKPFPVIGSVLRFWKFYLAAFAVVGIYAWWAASVGLREISAGAIGFLVGVVTRDLTWLRATARLWPINVLITNWVKVDELLSQKTKTFSE